MTSMLLVLLAFLSPTLADDPPAQDSALVRLLKSGRVPADRQPQIIAKIGQLGSANDLEFLFTQVLDPKGFQPAVRVNALEALADAALTRKGIKPTGDASRISKLFEPNTDPATLLAAIRLTGLWKVEPLADQLDKLATDSKADDTRRITAFEALAALGPNGKAAILRHTIKDRPKPIRAEATAALAKIDPTTAAKIATDLISAAEKGQDFTALMGAFLDRQDGAATLAKAIEAAKLPPDNAKLALRAIYALGRADEPLIAALSTAAGITAETKPPTKAEMDKLVADVTAKGDPARGEAVFRRPELNCIRCHSLAGAGGGVGPDLSSVGLSSPIDYVINSILLPDQAIKEQYHTLVVATTDGQIFQGILAAKDDTKVVLKQATGELKTIPAAEIDESKEGGSLMPKGLANLLTRDDFLDLVRFISELGKPGRYNIHATPTIQRWNLLKPVPEDLQAKTPDAGTFVSKIRDADPKQWTPVYALSTGEVPAQEFAQQVDSKVIYLKGEIEVSAPGNLNIDLGTVTGVTAWLDDAQAPASSKAEWNVIAGKHAITLRINTAEAKTTPVKVELAKAPGSQAEFTVISK